MKIKTYVSWEIKDKNGKLISHMKKEAKSFTQHFLNIIYCQASQTTLGGQNDTGGVSRTMGPQAQNISFAAAAADGTYGLVVGTSDTAVNIGDTALAAKIAHGTGSGQLSHGTVTINTPSTVSGTRSFTMQRVFTNNSGSNILIKEIGLYAKSYGGYIFLVERTLATSTITAGTSGTLTYTIQITV